MTLRALAEAATSGPWTYLIDDYELGTMFVTNDPRNEQRPVAQGIWRTDAAYIAAASPDRILALLAERDALLAVAEAARHAGATWDADQSGPWRPWEVYVDDFDALRSALTRLDAMLP